MNVSFAWNTSFITDEQKEVMETNIRNEIEHHIDPDAKEDIVISMFGDSMSPSLEGVAANSSGNALVKITYSPSHPHLATYAAAK